MAATVYRTVGGELWMWDGRGMATVRPTPEQERACQLIDAADGLLLGVGARVTRVYNHHHDQTKYVYHIVEEWFPK